MELRGGGRASRAPAALIFAGSLLVMQCVDLACARGTSAADCFPLQRAEKGKGRRAELGSLYNSIC